MSEIRQHANFNDLKARAEQIRKRAEAGKYHNREHFGVIDADDDVLFLLAYVTKLERKWKAEHDMRIEDIEDQQKLQARAEAAEASQAELRAALKELMERILSRAYDLGTGRSSIRESELRSWASILSLAIAHVESIRRTEASQADLREALKQEHDELQAEFENLNRTLSAEIVRMDEALKAYGQHKPECAKRDRDWAPCDCGLDAALASASTPEKE